MRALDLGAFPNDRVVAELLLHGLGERAPQLKPGDLGFLLEVDEQPQCAQAARGARFDGHHNRFESFAGGDVLDRGGVLGQLRQALSLGQFEIGHDQPLYVVRRFVYSKPISSIAATCLAAAAAPTPWALASASSEASALAFSAAIMTEPTVLLGPGERGLDRVSQKVPGCRAFHHGGGHAVDPLFRASGGLPRRRLLARQAR